MKLKIELSLSQNYAKKKLKPLINATKVLISNSYKLSGRNINIKFRNKGKYIVPGTIEGEGNVTRYPISIDSDINDLIKGYINLIDYKLVKEVDITVYNNLSIDSNQNVSDLNSNNDNTTDFIEYISSEHTDSS